MTDRISWARATGTPLDLQTNAPLVLDGDGEVLVVEEGSVALFSVDVRGGAPAGPRRLLQRIGSGQALFAVPLPILHRHRLAMVPIAGTRLRRIRLEDLWSSRTDGDNPVCAWLDEWIGLLANLVTVPREPSLPLRLAGVRELELTADQELVAERNCVAWCESDDASLHWLSGEEGVHRSEGAPLVLAGPLWARADEPTSIRVSPTQEQGDVERVAAGLGQLHALVLHDQLAQRTAEATAERARLRERDFVASQRTADAYADLAGVLEPGSARIHGDNALLRALTAVGCSLGVAIHPPMRSERASERVDPVEAILRASRLRARRVRLSDGWWTRDCGALLGFSADDQGRPLALVRGRSGRYEAYDPETDARTPLDKRNANKLAPDAWMVYRPLPEGRLRLQDLLRFSIAGRAGDLGLAIGAGVVATGLGMITPQATAALMDRAVPDADETMLWQIGLGLLFAAFGQVVFQLCQGIALLRLGLASSTETQAAVWDRLLRLRPSFFRGFSSGDLQSRVTAVSEIGQQLSGATLSSLFSGLLAALNLGLLYYYSPRLSALALAIGVVVVAFTAIVGMFVRRNVRQLVELDGQRFGWVVQLIQGVGKLRVAGAADRAFTQWMRDYSRSMKLWANTYRLEDRVFLFNLLVPTLSSAALFLVAHQLLVDGRQATVAGGLTLGTFLAFSAGFGTFLAGITSLSNTAVGLLDVLAKGQRVKPILEAVPETDTSKADPGVLSGRLAMTGVYFRYAEDGPSILRGVDLHAEPGEFVAIVGPSGSGKSTILRLLLGFEAPTEGTVSYDGQDLATLDVLAVRRQMGVVLQGGKLDSGSVFDNIACGTPLSLDDAWAAAEDAGFADDVRAMPMGMHTIVSVGGGNLSGGQRQRLLIARALAQRPKILLLDEATSALDNRTQAIVAESLERLNVTRIAVAHRLSTIRRADRIYVIEGGRVAQTGRFDELMRNSDELFARMMRRQLA